MAFLVVLESMTPAVLRCRRWAVDVAAGIREVPRASNHVE
jgi:hypothetical protein